MIYDILTIPDPRLHRHASAVTTFDSDLQMLVLLMFKTMWANDGIGLAAPQIGKSMRVFVMDTDGKRHRPFYAINPEITERSGQQTSEEGCLSIPGKTYRVARPAQIKLRYSSLNGVEHETRFAGLSATCACHEIDHLDGKLISD